MNKKIIPIFFASDKNYLPYLTVAIKSLIDKANNNDEYKIYILTNDIKKEDILEIKSYEKPNVFVEIADVNTKIESIKSKLALRDYYSVSIYFRLFISTMFPQYNKAIYLDSDIILNADIAEMYNVDIKNNYLGAVLDETVYTNKKFVYYVNNALGVTEKQYFNSGVLIMNLEKFRKNNIEEDFYKWVNNYKFGAVAPDQDYLNVTCKNSVIYLNLGWNKMPIGKNELKSNKLFLIHYNMFMKPWKYQDILYESYFWHYAKQTSYYNLIKNAQQSYTAENKKKDALGLENLLKLATNIANSNNNYKQLVLKDLKNKKINSNNLVLLRAPIKSNHRK